MSDMEKLLESRVARTEANVESIAKTVDALTRDVRALSASIQDHSEQVERQIKELLVSVTTAAGPRKTDWHLVLGGVGLVLAIGAAVFSPLMLRIADARAMAEVLTQKIDAHANLASHPVGIARLDALEKILTERGVTNTAAIDRLDAKLQKEFELSGLATKEMIAALKNNFEDVQRNGSGVTRERLAIIEQQLKAMERERFQADGSRR